MRYYIIGHIAILNVSEDPKKDAEEILRRHRNVKTVLLKVGELSGEFRVGRYVLIAGEPITETIHVEHGLRFLVDPTKAYFNPALESERSRIVRLIPDGSCVLDMFAGVGTLAVRIAAEKSVTIYAVEKNPYAYKYLLRNIELNRKRLKGKIIAVHDDASRFAYRLRDSCDHIIMDLPRFSREFLPDAAAAIKDGGVIHYYRIVERLKTEAPRIELLQVFPDIEILEERRIRGVSPSKVLMRISARVLIFKRSKSS